MPSPLASVLLDPSRPMPMRLLTRHVPPPIVMLLIAGAYVLHLAIFGWYVADDAGISLAYARNIASGFGPVLYPGAPAVEGYSNPLWVALLAAASLLRLGGADGIPLLKLLGAVLGGTAILLTWRLGRSMYPDRPDLQWVAPGLLAVWTPFVFWSGAGLENALYACALVAAALLHLREIRGSQAFPWSAVALLAVALTRPEGCAFALAFLVHRLVAGGQGVRRPRALAAWAGVFLVPFAAFLALRWIVFGDWLPNTYYAKVLDRELAWLMTYATDPKDPGAEYVAGFAAAAWPLLLPALAGVLDVRRWRAGLLVLAIAGGTALYAVYVGGDFWPEWRFFTAALPFIAVAAQQGIALMTRRAGAAASIVAAVVAGVVLHQSLGRSYELRLRDERDSLISLQGRLAQARRIDAIAARLGVEDPLYMDADIGGPALAGLRVLDLGGLADIHVARFDYYPPFFRAYVFDEQRPHFIRTHASWTRTSRVTEYPEFLASYVPLREYRDARGLHGEFVRRDLLEQARRPEPARPRPSWRQAMNAARDVRLREAAREETRWIEYYVDRRRHADLRAAYLRHKAAGTLPGAPARLDDLAHGLIAAGQIDEARGILERIGRPLAAPVPLHLGGERLLTLVAHRTVRREFDTVTRLQLFVEVHRTPPRDLTLWLHLFPQGRTNPERITRHQELGALSRRWRRGGIAMIEKALYVDGGEYEVRAGLWQPQTRVSACLDAGGTTCYLLLGSHRLTP